MAILALPTVPALATVTSEGWESALAIYWAGIAVAFIPVVGWFVLIAPFVATYAQRRPSKTLPKIFYLSLAITIPLWTLLWGLVLAVLPNIVDAALLWQSLTSAGLWGAYGATVCTLCCLTEPNFRDLGDAGKA